jgi:NAD(P)H-hydrate epimerase
VKVLTAEQMRDVDRRTIESGIPGLILMENAGQRVVEFLAARFSPLAAKRVTILCGKGNNGGDGMVIARQLFTRLHPSELHVILAAAAHEMSPDAAAQFGMLEACGCPIEYEITAAARRSDIVLDALLGTGLRGPATGRMAVWIHEINTSFPDARIVAVDIPSGMPSDSSSAEGECVRAHYTVTFTAPKIAQAMPPNCDLNGELIVAPIGSPESLFADVPLSLVEVSWFTRLFTPRPRAAHKGDFGHVLLVAGSRGKTGAAAMAALAALRSGAGLVTVATPISALPSVAQYAPEFMTADLPETPEGTIAKAALAPLRDLARDKTVIAIGPGLTTHPETVAVVRALAAELPQPVVVDADGLNALATAPWTASGTRVLTPHPGEMSRLCGTSTAAIQSDRLQAAQRYASQQRINLVLKGERTVLAFPDGETWINPTGTPAMATGGTGDILTGLIAGLIAQHPNKLRLATAAAVWLHGRAGELGAAVLGEQALIATDLLRYLPEAMRDCRPL